MRRPALVRDDPAAPPAIRRVTGRRADRSGGPTALVRGEWVDPDDVKPDAKRRPRMIEGWRCHCVLRRNKALGGDISDEQIEAADRFRRQVDHARLGFSAPRDLFDGGGHTEPGPSQGPSDAAVAQAMASEDVAAALRHCTTDQRRLLIAVVLSNHALAVWAATEGQRRERRVDPKIEMGRLLAVLDQLVEHYKTDIAADRAAGLV